MNTATNALGSVVGAVAGAKTRDQFMNGEFLVLTFRELVLIMYLQLELS